MTVTDSALLVKAPRRRRSPDEMRARLIGAARDLLRLEGPQAVTLKAVALRAGVTHGNVTYHFGTIEALQSAMITTIIEDLTAATAISVGHLRHGEAGPRDVVDVVSDAFAAAGAGRLVAFLIATGAVHHVAPFYAIIADLVGGLADGEAGRKAGGAEAIGEMMAMIVVSALGESLIGPGLESALGLAPGRVRDLAADNLLRLRENRARSLVGDAPSDRR